MQPPNPASSSLAHSSQFDECAAIVAIPSLLLLCAFSDEGDFDSHHLYDGGPISNGYDHDIDRHNPQSTDYYHGTQRPRGLYLRTIAHLLYLVHQHNSSNPQPQPPLANTTNQVTEYPDSTLTITRTSCRGANPTPSLGLQVVDTTPTRTDSYNSLYATPTPNAAADGFFTLDYLPATQGKLFNIDCFGRLIVAAPGGGQSLFGAMSYYQPGFEVVYFMTLGDVVKRDYIYIYCSFASTGNFLDCRAPESPPTADLTMFQMCPLYDEFFDTPLVIANYQSTDAPECYGLRFRRL